MKSDERDETTEGMNRRQFLILAATCAALTKPTSSYARDAEQSIDAGPISIYSSDGLYDKFRDFGFFVLRKGEKLTALSSYCTHEKCKLKAERDHSFYCRCHGSTFDPGGKVTQGPATRNLPVLPTANSEGHLIVKVPGT
jgi:Rieske Fe-S protein